jgi:hypothetical protein
MRLRGQGTTKLKDARKFTFFYFRKEKTMKMKKSMMALIVLCLIMFASDVVQAGVRDDWDWVNDPCTGRPRRNLRVWINDPCSTVLGDEAVTHAVGVAMETLNGAGSGWNFQNGTQAAHDIEICVADINENVGGSQNEFTRIDRNRRVSKRTITIDPTPIGGETWRSTGDSFDPNLVIMHELIHKSRIRHQTGTTTGFSHNVADPSLKGDHQRTLSNDDRTDMRDSNTAPVRMLNGNAGPGNPGARNFQLDNTRASFPDNTFQTDVEIGYSLTSDFETVIDPFDILGPDFTDYRIIRGVLIDITGATANDASGLVSFSLEYRDQGFDLDDPEYLPVEEQTLTAFIYDITMGVWEEASLQNVFHDQVGNTFAFDLDVDDLLSGSNFGFDPANPSTAFTFVALGGLEVPEPATMILLALGSLALLRRRRG